MSTISAIRLRYRKVRGTLTERSRRRWAGAEALAIGRGGVVAVHRATGLSRPTIIRGKQEGLARDRLSPDRVRRRGAGRKRAVQLDPELLPALKKLVAPASRGDPESPLRWTSRSARHLSVQLEVQGHRASRSLVCRMLHAMGYSLQANRKTREGSKHPDRDAQFQHINDQAAAWLRAGSPVISVDTKKKELVGDFKKVRWREISLHVGQSTVPGNLVAR
jgi:hypothetical protein